MVIVSLVLPASVDIKSFWCALARARLLTAFHFFSSYLRATKDLVQSVSLLEGDLSKVDALKEVKDNLIGKKDQIHETLISEIHRHIYDRVSQECLDSYRRQKVDKFGESLGTVRRDVARIC